MGRTTADALLAAICAEPDDDGPRLAYSDWLEEHGDVARAEFIRAGCRRARLEPWHADWSMLAWRERVLLARHERSWRAELPKIEGVTWGSFERGFVHEVSAASPGVLAARAGDILRAAPVRWATLGGTTSDWESCAPLPFLRGLQFVHVPIFEANLDFLNCTALDRNPDSVFQSPLLSTLTALDLSSFDIREELLGALARSPYLANLRTLVLDRSILDRGNLRLLLASAISPNLTTLRLRGCQWKNGQGALEYGLGPEAIALLAESESLAGLASLNLGENAVTVDSLRLLLQSPHLAGLRELGLGRNRLEARDAKRLAEVVTPMRLHRLAMAGNPIGDEGAAALARAAFCAELADLILSDCGITDRGLQELAGAPWLRSLGLLDLTGNRAGAGGMHALCAALEAGQLFELGLGDTDLDAKAIEQLVDAPGAGRLRALNLSGNRLETAAVEALAASPRLGQLRHLGLGRCGLDEKAARVLARAPWLAGLWGLSLAGNPIADRGLVVLLADGRLSSLNKLDLCSCALSSAAAEALAAARLPELHWLSLGNPFGLADLVDLPGRLGLPATRSPGPYRVDASRNSFGALGAAALARSRLGENLAQLDLSKNGVGDQGAAALSAGTWPMLRLLNLKGNGVTLTRARTLDWSPAISSALLIDFEEMILMDSDGWYPPRAYYETIGQRYL